MFILIIYGITFIGSFSLGYLILRTAFPEKQKLLPSKKLIYGYLIGVPIIIISSAFGENYFFFIFTFISVLIFTLALGKRLSLKEEDFVKLKKIKKQEIVPEKALTREEKIAINNKVSIKNTTAPKTTNSKTVFNAPNKRISASPIIAINDSKENNDSKEHIFKDDNTNMSNLIDEKKVFKNVKEKEKKEILERLKKIAKDIKKSEPLENDDDNMKIEDLQFE